ncbi:uncharacterized protein LOC119745886 isoform X3 [Patiria miniata]|uniref:Uncharacterized protein n=1 Tax=Patiria miniata TaxID=46514 RepID=A0A914BS75_PATMI|nr:uncharacterized protein LOC119745886 isoform X3 [Patiria miniata]
MPSLIWRLVLAIFLTARQNFIEAGQVSGKCEPITVSTCRGSGVLHRYTRMPVEVPGPGPMDHQHFMTQHEAVGQLQPYLPIMSKARGCREYLKPLLCAVYLRPCDHESVGGSLPCRDLCEKAQASCKRTMRHVGLDWPRQLDCTRFPSATQYSTCMSALNVGPVEEVRDSADNVPTVEVRVTCSYELSPKIQPQWLTPDGNLITDDEMERIFAQRVNKHTTNLVILRYTDSFDSGNYTCIVGDSEFTRSVTLANIYEPEEEQTTCEPIPDFWWCRSNVNYAEIQLPNTYGMRTKDEIRHKLERYSEVARSGCSQYIGAALCATYLTECDSSRDAHRPMLCRDLCEKVDRECAEAFREGGVEPLSCDGVVRHTDGDCYNGIEISPAESFDTATGKRVEVECYHAPIVRAVWVTPDGASLRIPGDPESRITVEVEGRNILRLVINDFVDFKDAGRYTCSDWDTFNRTITIDNIYQPNVTTPSRPEIEIGEVNQVDVLGIRFTSVACVSTSQPPFLPIWLDLYGAVVPLDEANPFSRFIASKVSESEAMLFIRDFEDSTDAGVYTCLGQGPDSAQTIVIGDITLGPQINLTEPQGEIVIGDVTISDFAGSVIASVGCTSTSIPPFQPIWLDIYGAVVSRDISANPFSRNFAVNTSDGITGLFIRDFKDSTDAGVYTCLGQGPDSAQTIVIGDITLGPQVNLTDPSKQPQGEIVIGEVTTMNIAGFMMTSVGCASTSIPPFQPIWLDIYGAVVPRDISANPFSRHFAVNTSDSVTGLIIRDFKDSTDAGVYTCLGQGPDSAQTVVIGDITLGPQVNLTDPSKQPPDEIEISEVVTLDIIGSIYASVACISKSSTPFQPIWLDLYGAVVPIAEDIPTNQSSRILAVRSSDGVTGLVISDFKDSTDAGVYTCLGQDPDSAQTIVIGDITQGPLANPTTLPSVAEPSEQPNEIVIGEVSTINVVGSVYASVSCTSQSSPPFQPIWLDLYGAVVPRDIVRNPFSHHFGVNTSDSVTELVIKDFEDSTDAGVYTCLGQGPDSAQTIVIGDITQGPLANPSEQPPCEEIRIPDCSVGIGYSSTYVPSLVGLGQNELGDVFRGLEPVFANPCSPYFRPYMCALYLPPCRERAVLPCKELCLTAVDQCAETLRITFSVEELAGMRESCASMPSENEPGAKCHNVKEVEIGAVAGAGTRRVTVECTYNLLPPVQPRWFSPSGREILSGSWRRVRVIESSDSITVLEIKNYAPHIDEGSYTCAGPIQRVTVDL